MTQDMRRLMRLAEAADPSASILLEGRDAPLFHFTNRLLPILCQNKLVPGPNSGGGISLTRDLATPFYSYFAKPNWDCLILDQGTLARRYRISAHYGDSAARLPDLLRKHEEDGQDVDPDDYLPKKEQEERLFGVVQPLNRYLIAIVVEDDFMEGGDLSMEWVQKVAYDSALMTIMAVGMYSKLHAIPVVERAALRRNGTWTSEITKKLRVAAAKLARRHAKDQAAR